MNQVEYSYPAVTTRIYRRPRVHIARCLTLETRAVLTKQGVKRPRKQSSGRLSGPRNHTSTKAITRSGNLAGHKLHLTAVTRRAGMQCVSVANVLGLYGGYTNVVAFDTKRTSQSTLRANCCGCLTCPSRTNPKLNCSSEHTMGGSVTQ